MAIEPIAMTIQDRSEIAPTWAMLAVSMMIPDPIMFTAMMKVSLMIFETMWRNLYSVELNQVSVPSPLILSPTVRWRQKLHTREVRQQKVDLRQAACFRLRQFHTSSGTLEAPTRVHCGWRGL